MRDAQSETRSFERVSIEDRLLSGRGPVFGEGGESDFFPGVRAGSGRFEPVRERYDPRQGGRFADGIEWAEV